MKAPASSQSQNIGKDWGNTGNIKLEQSADLPVGDAAREAKLERCLGGKVLFDRSVAMSLGSAAALVAGKSNSF